MHEGVAGLQRQKVPRRANRASISIPLARAYSAPPVSVARRQVYATVKVDTTRRQGHDNCDQGMDIKMHLVRTPLALAVPSDE